VRLGRGYRRETARRGGRRDGETVRAERAGCWTPRNMVRYDTMYETDDAPEAFTPRPTRVTEDVLCLSCGYNLRGLALGDVCPECGAAVARSMLGNRLRYASLTFVKRLHTAMVMELGAVLFMLLGSIAMFGIVFAMQGRTAGVGAGLMGLIGLSSALASFVSLAAMWIFTTEDPGSLDPSSLSLRATVRGSLIVLATVMVLNIVFTTGTSFTGPTIGAGAAVMILGVVGLIANIVRYVSVMTYLAKIAARIPNEKLQKSARRFRWLGPVLVFPGVFLCGIGPLAAYVLYIGIIDTARKSLRNVVREIEGDAGAGSAARM